VLDAYYVRASRLTRRHICASSVIDFQSQRSGTGGARADSIAEGYLVLASGSSGAGQSPDSGCGGDRKLAQKSADDNALCGIYRSIRACRRHQHTTLSTSRLATEHAIEAMRAPLKSMRVQGGVRNDALIKGKVLQSGKPSSSESIPN